MEAHQKCPECKLVLNTVIQEHTTGIKGTYHLTCYPKRLRPCHWKGCLKYRFPPRIKEGRKLFHLLCQHNRKHDN